MSLSEPSLEILERRLVGRFILQSGESISRERTHTHTHRGGRYKRNNNELREGEIKRSEEKREREDYMMCCEVTRGGRGGLAKRHGNAMHEAILN